MSIDSKLDLVLEKILDITPEQAFKGWTTPALFKEWFCPKPWTVVEAKVDLHPGGDFSAVMQSPEGERFPSNGCVLEVIPNKKLVWTSALLPGFRPAAQTDLAFTGIILFEASGNKTKYTAIARHGTPGECQKHAQMGFQEGWGICADQLVTLMKNL